MQVAIASSSQLAADAGGRIAEAGGNAVDAAIAAALVSLVTEPGIVSLPAGGFVTIWPPDGPPVVVDGAAEMPGRESPRERFGGGGRRVRLEYGGGMETIVGFGSVASPGIVAAMGLAAELHGRLPWRELVEPARDAAREGFPLSRAAHDYLRHTHDGVFGWNRDGFAALHGADGRLLAPGETVRVPHLADSLEVLATEGAQSPYRGTLAALIGDYVSAEGGLLGRADLAAYRAELREPLTLRLADWTIATAPPPSVGGTTLAAMLTLASDAGIGQWDGGAVRRLVEIQRQVLGYRRERLDTTTGFSAAARHLLARVDAEHARVGLASPSTVHTSAADDGGLACSLTASAGYGSGVMPPGTGLWLNNCLGELELNGAGYHAWSPGQRLPSNMAPSVACRPDGTRLAIGSPGADRITTAILQTLVNFVVLGMPLTEAVDHPRLHLERGGGTWRVAYERGLPMEAVDLPTRAFEPPAMFFGGVTAALHRPGRGFTVAGDVRRRSGTRVAAAPPG